MLQLARGCDNNVIYEVAEDALADLTGTATERAYLRGDYLEQRREIMHTWWNYIYSSTVLFLRSLSFLEPVESNS